jgi:hypothetical protein
MSAQVSATIRQSNAGAYAFAKAYGISCGQDTQSARRHHPFRCENGIAAHRDVIQAPSKNGNGMLDRVT